MKCVHCAVIFATILINVAALYAGEKADIIVDTQGNGDFTTIMDAITSIPQNNNSWKTILVKDGTYNEHIFIDRSFIAIVGESREHTIIRFSLSRDDWYNSHRTNAGSAVIDIGVSSSDGVSGRPATDVVIANLTVENTYNNAGVKTHVIRGEGGCNRVSVINCNVWCKGHDTIALWNKATGMYYHANCSFKGSVDAVCPRGWCYTVGCDFYEVTSSSPLWHEVAAGSSQKFVIRTGNFYVADGNNSSFRLLNRNNSSSLGTRYFLLDCMITEKAGTKGNYTEAYFHNCHGESRDQSWYADNLSSAGGSPGQEKINAHWTFDKQWDPENTLPAVLPTASLPQPWDKAYDVPSEVELRWINGRNATESLLYFGKENPPPFVTDGLEENSWSPGKLSSDTYYWRVDAVDGTDTVSGDIWSFTIIPGVTEILQKNVKTEIMGQSSVHQNSHTITFFHNESQQITPLAAVIDISGRVVAKNHEFMHLGTRTVLNRPLSPGAYFFTWNYNGTRKKIRFVIR